MIVHLLQIIDRDRNLFARRAIRLLAGTNTHGNFPVVIGSVGNSRDHVAGGELAFLAIARNCKIRGDDERASRRIKSRRNLLTACSSRCRLLASRRRSRFRRRLLGGELRLHFFRNRCLDLGT